MVAIGYVGFSGCGAMSTPGDAYGNVFAAVRLLADGRLRQEASGQLPYLEFPPGSWFSTATPGIGADYEARFINQRWTDRRGNAWVEGSPGGTWITISEEPWQRIWGDMSARLSIWEFDVQIRHKATGVIVASGAGRLRHDARVTTGDGTGDGGSPV